MEHHAFHGEKVIICILSSFYFTKSTIAKSDCISKLLHIQSDVFVVEIKMSNGQ
jgi:hypothetical protein